jgi:hypothetical protein
VQSERANDSPTRVLSCSMKIVTVVWGASLCLAGTFRYSLAYQWRGNGEEMERKWREG